MLLQLLQSNLWQSLEDENALREVSRARAMHDATKFGVKAG
jgi:hydrogenase maturation factor